MFLEPVGYLSANRFFFRWLFFTYTEYSEFEIGNLHHVAHTNAFNITDPIY